MLFYLVVYQILSNYFTTFLPLCCLKINHKIINLKWPMIRVYILSELRAILQIILNGPEMWRDLPEATHYNLIHHITQHNTSVNFNVGTYIGSYKRHSCNNWGNLNMEWLPNSVIQLLLIFLSITTYNNVIQDNNTWLYKLYK